MIGFVVNPVSGNGRGWTVWKKVEEQLNERNITYAVKISRYPGEATSLAAALGADERCQKVVAIGGDGTVSEVAAGLMQVRRSCPLGHIPAGSGNDFARGHGLPLDSIAALKHILAEQTGKRIDVLMAGGRSAVNSIGIGFDGKVVQVANRSLYKVWLNRLGLGKLIYALSTLRVWLGFRPCGMTVTVDGRNEYCPDSWGVAITNIPYYGGSMMICPQAVPDDGMADVMVVTGLKRLKLLPILTKVYKGKHLSHPAIRFFRGRVITIRPDAPQLVHFDGDLAEEVATVTIVVEADRLEVLKPLSSAMQTTNSRHDPVRPANHASS
ncbi:MAG: diacylglycerol kinase family lipid kinase [Brevibacillus sp.]|nr:diacylglycerol kinase family lipid kinase [Brevibacillus sp.]